MLRSIQPKTIQKRKISINYSEIDNQIIYEIDLLSKTNKKVWSSPTYNRRDNVHCFFQYPAMMVPIVQRQLIKVVLKARPDIKNMFDPYMGAATSIVAAMQNGLNCYGQDINPLAILLSKVKTGAYYYEAFETRATTVISSARKSKSVQITAEFPGRNKWFKPQVAIELSRLVKAIQKEESITARRLFWITLAETIRLTSNDRTSTYKLHARPLTEIKERNPSPIDIFENLISKNIEDVKSHTNVLKELNLINKGVYQKAISITLQDSSTKVKKPNSEGKEELFDLLVSSPPYGDNKTTIPYGQHAFLPLQWIDLNDIDPKVSRDYLRTTLEIDTRSLGGRIKKLTTKELDSLLDKSPTFERLVKRLGVNHQDKIKKVVNFIFDFDTSLDLIVSSLKPNGYMIWTIGNRNVGEMEVKNDKILIELLKHREVKLIKTITRKILNKRMAQRNSSASTMNTEKILIFRKVE